MENMYNAFAICPHCGYVDKDSFEILGPNDEDGDVDCNSCGKTFYVLRHVDISYSTSFKKPQPCNELAAKKYRLKNREVTNARIEAWRVRNLHKRAADTAKHLAAKRRAIPKWADLSEIEDVYMEAAYMQMDVDHIVPLQSSLVCGLHVVDNLQLLPKLENISKGNRYWPDMPTEVGG